MATFVQLPSANWRAQLRRKGRYVAESFRRRKDAEEWALDAERRIDRGESPTSRAKIDPATFGDLIDLHLEDLKEIGRTARRSKAFSLDQLREKLGRVRLKDLDRERLIKFGRDRAREGAGPVSLSIDFTDNHLACCGRSRNSGCFRARVSCPRCVEATWSDRQGQGTRP